MLEMLEFSLNLFPEILEIMGNQQFWSPRNLQILEEILINDVNQVTMLREFGDSMISISIIYINLKK